MHSVQDDGNTDRQSAAVPLDYAKHRQPRPGTIALRWAIAVAVLVFLGACVRSFLHWYRLQWIAYQGQRDVEAVIAPPGAVLFSEDATEIARLTGQAQYERLAQMSFQMSPSAIERVSAWFTDPNQPGAKMRSGMPPIGLRRVPGGDWRLIDVGGGQGGSRPDGSRRFMFPTYDVMTRVTPWPGTRPKQLWYGTNELSVLPTDCVTLFAGQLDPVNESHFTFDYAINNVRGTVDGYLGTDDNVTFKIGNGPATTRPYKPRFGRQAYP